MRWPRFTAQMGDSATARARWFRPRLSVRALMIIVLVAGAGIG
jgi:hypothetical protein